MDGRSFLRRGLALCARLMPPMLAANLVLVSLAMFLPVGALAAAAAVTAANFALALGILRRWDRRMGEAEAMLLAGVQRIAGGEAPSLPEDGAFPELCAALNRAGYRAAERERTREDWVRGISHDIRTPLALALGYAGELEEDPSLPPAAREQAGIIRRQAERLRRLVEDLGLISKLEAHMRPLRPEKLSPAELARRAAVDFLEQERRERWPVELDVERAPDAIEGDESLLARMLGNLLQNAAAHNPGGCRIRLLVEGSGEWCRFVVSDDGAGAASEKLAELNAEDFPECVFRPVGQSAAHGLGLRLVCRIVQAHGGRVCFANETPHGFRVEVELPGGQRLA